MEASPYEDSFRQLYQKHADEDGKLRAKELKAFILELSRTEITEPLRFSTETCRSLITMMDRNRTGGVNFEETLKMWKEVKGYISVFQQFDVERSGELKTSELDKLFSTLGFPVNRRVETAIVRRYTDRNNRIRLTDFIIVVCKLTLMYEIFKDQQNKSGSSSSASFSMNEFLYYTMYC
uniref:Calpain small subunit 1-like n=1 Tax=Crassostrea virginica TaxID=6565 RepID=A0A8B8CQJ9_CRAVI|nr:calpain small subunit 1-like [Crassostrea virginica]